MLLAGGVFFKPLIELVNWRYGHTAVGRPVCSNVNQTIL